MVDDSLKRFYHDLGFNIVRFSEKKIPLDENGNPKTGAVMEELHPIRPDVMAAKNWGVKHSNDPKCDNILFLDWDRGKILPEVRRLMITYRNKGDQESCHGIIRVADADKKWCEELARTHGMAGLEIFTRKKNLALFGNYEIKDTDRRSQWHWIDSMVENGKIIDVTKEKLGRIFQRKALVTGSAAVPAGVGERHNAILKECFALAKGIPMAELDFDSVYSGIISSGRIEGMEEYREGSAKHSELADMIKHALRDRMDAHISGSLVENLKSYCRKDDRGRPIPPAISDFAEVFNNDCKFAKIIGDYNLGHLLFQQGTVYTEGAYEMIERMIEKAYPGNPKNFRREVIAKIGARNPTGRDEFDADPNIRNVKNGFLDTERGELVDLPDYKSMRQLDFEFKPELGRSELFEQKMAEWMPDEEIRNGLWEVAAAAFLKDSVRFENIVMFQGEGGNGKSTLLHVLKKMLGEGNVTALSWQDIEHDRFAPQRLDGVYANIFYDMKPDALKSTTNIRSLVDREPISVQRKGVDGYDMTYTGRMYFSCNTLPELPDMGHFMMRRLLLFKFENKFTGETKIGDLREMLTTPEEKSKIFNSFLPYMQKILKNGRVSYTQDEGKLRSLWMRHASSSTQFAVEMLERTASMDGSLKTKEIYEMYLKWCHDHTKTPDGPKVFTKALENQLYLQIHTTYKGEKTTYWKNMRIKGSDNHQQETL